MNTKKIFKFILLILIAILIIFVVNTIRKIVIISNLQNKVSKYINYNNYYLKSVSNQGEGQIIEFYKKDNCYITNLTSNSLNGSRKLIIYFNGKTTNTYIEVNTDNNTSKVAILDSDGVSNGGQITNYIHTNNIGELLFMAMIYSINTEIVNNVECYKMNNLFIQKDSEVGFYIDKKTGLAIRIMEVANSIIDGNKQSSQIIVDYDYKFDIVTDEDLKEPDINQYQIQENY